MQLPVLVAGQDAKRSVRVVAIEGIDTNHQLAVTIPQRRAGCVCPPDGRMATMPVYQPDAALSARANLERGVLAASHDVTKQAFVVFFGLLKRFAIEQIKRGAEIEARFDVDVVVADLHRVRTPDFLVVDLLFE
ncbi:hypothetical protein [Pandoraea terrigena]|uniref:hypothetical protein n=1 Tax=Pandoraea terrigena TaxID=2508292 RepID=UPI001240F01E|nr:hypothetical protein [Pandoraea terrigena]